MDLAICQEQENLVLESLYLGLNIILEVSKKWREQSGATESNLTLSLSVSLHNTLNSYNAGILGISIDSETMTHAV